MATVADLKVKFSADTGDAERGINRIDKSIKGLGGGFNLGNMFSFAAGDLIASGIRNLGGALAGGMTGAINASKDLNAQISAIGAVSGASAAELSQIKNLINELGIDPNLKVGATEAADAIEMLSKNGIALPDIMGGAARATVLLANATGAEFGTAADIASSAMSVFGIKAADMSSAVDGIASVAVNSRFDMNDYSLALGMAGGVAAQAGVEFDDFNATIAAISPAFSSGSQAGTSWKVMLQRLVPDTTPAIEAMAKLGLITRDGSNQFFTAAGAMKDQAEIAGLLHNATQSLTEEQRIAAFTTIFGTDAMVAAGQMAKFTEEEYRKFKDTLGQTDAEEAAALMMDNLSGDMEIFEGVTESLSTQLGDKLDPALRAIFQGITPMLAEATPAILAFADSLATNFIVPAIDAFIVKMGRVQELFAMSASFSGGLFAALGDLTGGEVQITAEGLITSVNWGDFIGVLDWKNYIASLTWGDFVGTFAWTDAVTSLAWGDFVLAFDWDDWVGTFAWGDFVSIVNWADWVYTLSWGDFLLNLDWGNFVFGFQWGDYVYQLGWADFVGMFEWTDYAVGLNWGDFVGSFNWADKVAAITWGDFIGVFSWEKWVLQIKWGDYVGRLSWSDFVDGITWENYVLTLNWGDFLFSVDWDSYLAVLVWGDFMSAADWNNWIYTLTWGDYVFQLDWSAYLPAFTAWTDYVSKLTWSDVVTAFDGWSTYISTLTWTDIIVTALDWATWIPALAWNEFVRTIDWVAWIVPFAWNEYISKFSWDDFVDGMLDWASYISSLDWGTYISGALEWSSYVAAVTWENFVAKLEWPNFIKGVNVADWIPSFPGWDYFFGGASDAAQGGSHNFSRNPGSSGGGGTGGFNAAGTNFWRGGWTWVGEEGPELLNLPRGSQILSNPQSMKMVGQLADGTGVDTAVANYKARMGGGADVAAKFKDAGDKVATKIQRQMEAAAKKLRSEMESALQGVPGLFGTSQVTQQQMDMANLGIPQNFADDWIRRLTDEVVNGVDWADTDIKDAALRAGIDPSLPAKAILELVKEQWNDSSFFAGGKNTELINQEAVQAALDRQAASASGEAAIKQLFGISPEEVTPAAVAMGGNMRAGIAQGLTSTSEGGATAGADLLTGLTNITPEQLAPVGAGIVAGLTEEIGKEEYADKIGAAFSKLFTGFLERKEALTDVGAQIMTRISESLGNAAGIDMVGSFATAFRAQLTLPVSIEALHDVGARILELVFQGYFDAAKNKEWPAATVQMPTAASVVQKSTGRSLALAGEGGPVVNVYATVASGIDIHQVAYAVADVMQKRGRR